MAEPALPPHGRLRRLGALALYRRGGRLCCVLLLGLPLLASAQHAIGVFDPEHTRFGVELRTRWGQRVVGRFPRYDGELVAVDERRHQVRVRLATAAVRIGDSERYTAMARGEAFFDASRYPEIEFVSDPVGEDEVRRGGQLRGRLTIRGVTRYEAFQLLPATCDRPGLDCDVVASGRIDRYDYGLDAWKLALDNHVRFTMRVRLLDKDPGP
ncbi:YceI family protein [Marilutibacter chinensis]|uniref:YceI family protein n=1 Tax=Marilutibacter chinensis TaxID=2912247 RepID=A0ABS9HX59_9GAMM|nr:YceI family protein [Lysobacter chinensis]MCF7222903.1 YceI family protein [Lysobacter chinensis]